MRRLVTKATFRPCTAANVTEDKRAHKASRKTGSECEIRKYQAFGGRQSRKENYGEGAGGGKPINKKIVELYEHSSGRGKSKDYQRTRIDARLRLQPLVRLLRNSGVSFHSEK